MCGCSVCMSVGIVCMHCVDVMCVDALLCRCRVCVNVRILCKVSACVDVMYMWIYFMCGCVCVSMYCMCGIYHTYNSHIHVYVNCM